MSDLLERYIAHGWAERIPYDAVAVERLLDDARLHLRTSRLALEASDLAGAYSLLYDAARKALTAALASEGFRVKAVGGAHGKLIDLAERRYAADDPDRMLAALDRVRLTRNEAEYVGHRLTPQDVQDDLVVAEAVVALAARRIAARRQ